MDCSETVWARWCGLLGVKSFYVNRRTCIRVGNGESDWFPFGVGQWQECVMSPWLFNVYMDGVVREVHAKMLGRIQNSEFRILFPLLQWLFLTFLH